MTKMLHMSKIYDYLKILTDKEDKSLSMNDIIFGEYFDSMKEKLYSTLGEEQNIRKVAQWLYDFP